MTVPNIDTLAATVRDGLTENTDAPDGLPRCGECGMSLEHHREGCRSRAAFDALHAVVEHVRTLERENAAAERYENALREYAKEEPCPDCNGVRTLPDGTDCEWCGATGVVCPDSAWDDGRRARDALAGEDA